MSFTAPSSDVPPLVWTFVADMASTTSRAELRSTLEIADAAALYDRALAVADAAGARFVAVARSSSGGHAVIPMGDLRELLGLGRPLHDIGIACGAVQYRALDLADETMRAASIDHRFLTGGVAGRA